MRLTTTALFASLLTLAACSGDKDSDTGATTVTGGTGSGTTVPMTDVEITAWNITSDGATTSISVSAGADAATGWFEMIQTGDGGFSCGPDKEVVCGVWQENFDLDGSGGSFSKDLTVVAAASDQVNGSTTLFDSADELNGLTVYIETTAGDGTTDCAVGGDNTAYYTANLPDCDVIN